MTRYFIELAYNGNGYNGWQLQPHCPSVQEDVNKSLSTLLHHEINVVGAGRTDTDVNASFFVAHFDFPTVIEDIGHLVYKMNRMLGSNIAIHKIYPVPPEMHARFSARSRTYKYFIDKDKDPFTYPFAFRAYPVPALEPMNEACKILFDYIDFTSFSKSHTDTKTNNCRIMEAFWEDRGSQLVFTIKADRFLRNMVRAIVGTMVAIGQGKLAPEDLRRIIESQNRCKAGTSVPGKALFLCDVEYDKSKIQAYK